MSLLPPSDKNLDNGNQVTTQAASKPAPASPKPASTGKTVAKDSLGIIGAALSGASKGASSDSSGSQSQMAHHFEPASYKTGTAYVPKTGPAILHKGEAVIPASENKSEGTVSTHRALMHLNHGGLHRALGLKESDGIPRESVETALGSKNDHVKTMAGLAGVVMGPKEQKEPKKK